MSHSITFHMVSFFTFGWTLWENMNIHFLSTCWTTFVFMCKFKSNCLSCWFTWVILGTGWTTFVFMCKLKSCLSFCHMTNDHVGPGDMPGKFCFTPVMEIPLCIMSVFVISFYFSRWLFKNFVFFGATLLMPIIGYFWSS